MMEIPVVGYYKPWLLFWVADIFAAGYFYYALYRKWRGWARGMKQPPLAGVKRWRAAKIAPAEVIWQPQLFGLSPFRWLVHLLISWGFIALAFLSLFIFGLGRMRLMGIGGGWADFFFHGYGHILIKIWGDAFGLALLTGLMAAAVRRFLLRPERQISNQIDIVLLVFLLWMTLSGFALEGLRLALVPSDVAGYSFVGRLFMPSGAYTLEDLRPWITAAWVLHAFSGLALLVYVPHSKLLHSLLAPVVIAMNAVEEQGREDLYWPDIPKRGATKLPEA
jgi:nitrate reductase gamma subunit